MNKDMRKAVSITVLSAFLFLQILPFLPVSIQNVPLVQTLKKASLFNPTEIDAAGLSSASATLSNPRLSFDTVAGATTPIGGSAITVNGTGSGDPDTRNIFPNDSAVVVGNAAISVASVSADLTTFILKSPLTAAATLNTTHIYVAQSGTLTVTFYTGAPIPAGGSIKITIPAPSSGGNDGIPVSAATVGASGFDTNGIAAGNITCPGGFGSAAVTTGTGGAQHVVTCNNAGGTVPSGAAITFIVGNGAVGLVNPAVTIGRPSNQRGIADIYPIFAGTYSGAAGAGTLLEDILMRVAPVEGVLVSATVDETLQFTVAGVAAGASTYCGKAHTAGITTSATAVPWGFISSGYSIDRNEAVQQLTVTTNAAGGYKVYAEENDQMGDEGATCTGVAPSAGEYTFGTSTCIRDYNLGTHTTKADWGSSPGVNYGFGYSLQNSSGTDAQFTYNGTGTYDAKQFADIQGSEDKYASNAELMLNSGPVSASSVFVCYRINIPGTQPAGYYYNKIKYTAVPKF